LEVYETVVGGALELLTDGTIDLAITPDVPEGFLGEPLMTIRFLPVAAPSHPLHALDRVTLSDLRDHHHLIIRDSGSRRDRAAAWNVAQNRITFSQTSTSIEAARRGMGFGWYAETLIGADLASGALKTLPLAGGGERFGELYLVFQDAEGAAPGAQHMAQIIRAIAKSVRFGSTFSAMVPPGKGDNTSHNEGERHAAPN
jgi:DNA-binding transcriptional LysR family regulator